MKKKTIVLCLVIVTLLTIVNTAFAAHNPNVINSDPVFSSISISLTTSKAVDFSFDTNDIVDYIKIWRCWLQKKVDDQWVFDRSLPAPSYIEYNTIGYDAYMDYSSYIPSDGNTYRIGARIEAAGHFVTRYSNQRTF